MVRSRLPQNKGLPLRWRLTHGAYYYQVPRGSEKLWGGKKLYRLGSTLPEAYKAWSERLCDQGEAKTIGGLIDIYLMKALTLKAPKTQRNQTLYSKKIRSAFGHMGLDELRPTDIYGYVNGRVAKATAKKEIALLSHIFTKAIEWGLIDNHPFKGKIRLEGQAPRSRYIEDWEIKECLALPSKEKDRIAVAKVYIKLKLLTGLRQRDLLTLTMSQIKDDGIHVTPSKTKSLKNKAIIFQWSDELRSVVNEAIATRPAISPYLFCTRRGKSYVDLNTGLANGWNSLWQYFIARLNANREKPIRFTEHDLRAKAGSDADSPERAKSLLTHADLRTTERFYRRKPEIIKPLR
jgi:integrase